MKAPSAIISLIREEYGKSMFYLRKDVVKLSRGVSIVSSLQMLDLSPQERRQLRRRNSPQPPQIEMQWRTEPAAPPTVASNHRQQTSGGPVGSYAHQTH